MSDVQIQHEDNGKKGRFFIHANGQDLAELTYVWAGKIVIADHTEVDEQLKGQGIGHSLLASFVAWARAQDVKIKPLCPFVKSVFDKNQATYNDVRAD